MNLSEGDIFGVTKDGRIGGLAGSSLQKRIFQWSADSPNMQFPMEGRARESALLEINSFNLG